MEHPPCVDHVRMGNPWAMSRTPGITQIAPRSTLKNKFGWFSGWWFQPLWKYESQLGSLFPIYGKTKNVPNHQPVLFLIICYFFDHLDDFPDTPSRLICTKSSSPMIAFWPLFVTSFMLNMPSVNRSIIQASTKSSWVPWFCRWKFRDFQARHVWLPETRGIFQVSSQSCYLYIPYNSI